MKKYSIILSIIFFAAASEAQWVQMSNGMGNNRVWALAVNGNSIFAGIVYPNNGLYLSTNNGTSWTQTSLIAGNVFSIAVNGNYIFAGTSFGVHLSTNNGSNWVQTSLNSNIHVLSLAANGTNVIAGGYIEVPKYTFPRVNLSTNNGTNWTQIFDNVYFYSLAVNGNNIFAGTYQNGVLFSSNNGIIWNQTSLNTQSVYSLAINGTYVFAGTGGNGVYMSVNNGSSWNQSSLNNQNVKSLAVNENNVFAGTSFNGVYVSINNGSSWTQKNEGLGNLNVRALCISSNYIFAGTDGNSIYRRPISDLTGIKQILSEIPDYFSLSQNYPNPFNPTTVISFQVAVNSFASIKIYDVLGKEIAALVNEQLSPGTYEVEWDAGNIPSGVYYYKLLAGSFSNTKKMVLIK